MSDFTILKTNEEPNPCYGMETFEISLEDIAALLVGGRLYTTINCGEYAIVIKKEAE